MPAAPIINSDETSTYRCDHHHHHSHQKFQKHDDTSDQNSNSSSGSDSDIGTGGCRFSYCGCSDNSSGSLSPVPELLTAATMAPFRIQSECRDNAAAALGKRRQSSSSLGSMTLSSSTSSLSLSLSDASPPDTNSLLVAIIGWYPLLVLRMLKTLFYMTCSQTLMALPVLWLWFVWRTVTLPLAIARHLLTLIEPLRIFRAYWTGLFQWKSHVATKTAPVAATTTTSSSSSASASASASSAAIMISNGSTIQALHLARNFNEIGARVICFEFEGLFPLAKFSNSVTKFYTLPKSCRDNSTEYVEHLKRIVLHENVSHFIPVCVTNTAILDAHVKPHLESINCSTFCPDIKNLALLDDCYTMLKFCEQFNKSVPDYRLIYNRDDLLDFYAESNNSLPARPPGIYYMYSSNNQNCSAARTQKIQLPIKLEDLPVDLLATSDPSAPSFIVHEPAGYENFFTCTTIKNSRLIANATCHLDSCGLVAVADSKIDRWLHDYFAMMSKHNDSLSGHVTFKFCRRRSDDELIPLSCKCSVSLPYVCYENTHAKIVLRKKITPGVTLAAPVANNSGRYWIHAEVYDALRNPTLATVGKLIGTVLDKREALFSIKDPLPYCAYFNLKVLRFIRQRRREIPRTFNILWYR